MNWLRELSFYVVGNVAVAFVFGVVSFAVGLFILILYGLKRRVTSESEADLFMEKVIVPRANAFKWITFIYLESAWAAVARVYVDVLNLNVGPSGWHSVSGFIFTLPIGSVFFVLFGLWHGLLGPFAWILQAVFPPSYFR